MTRPAARSTVLVDDERVRVTRFDFAPGAETGRHVHGHDHVVTPVTRCEMRLEEPRRAARTVAMEAGAAHRRDAGVEHDVVSAGEEPMSFVEVELK